MCKVAKQPSPPAPLPGERGVKPTFWKSLSLGRGIYGEGYLVKSTLPPDFACALLTEPPRGATYGEMGYCLIDSLSQVYKTGSQGKFTLSVTLNVPDPKKHTALTFFGLWLLTVFYIGLLPTRHYTPDAIDYLPLIVNGNIFELWHTQHLFGLWPNYWLYHALEGRLPVWQAARIAQAMLGGFTVAVVYLTVLRLTRASRIALVSGLILWVSYGFWHFQSDPDIYSIGYVGVALLLLAYVHYVTAPSVRRVLWLATAAAFAILAHQMNLELVGIIGVSLLWLGWRSGRYSHVVLYGCGCALLVSSAYVIGWLSVKPSLVRADGSSPSFVQWLLGYFDLARTGQATWGSSLTFKNLPTAAYGFLSSWVLVPKLDHIPLVAFPLLGMLILGAVILVLHAPRILMSLPMPQRQVAVVCLAAILVNAISSWWWQAGNIKFDLFMQISLILVAALYAQQIGTSHVPRTRFIGSAALGMILVGLAVSHLLWTLPYETQGGVFAATDALAVAHPPTTVYFEYAPQASAYGSIKAPSAPPGAVLPTDFCHTAALPSQTWWIVRQQTADSCPALIGSARIGSYQADRSRDQWIIFTAAGAS